MYFILLGEGPSDLGTDNSKPGTFVKVLEKLADEVSSESFDYEIVSRGFISLRIKQAPSSPRKMLLRGSKRKYGDLIYFQKSAEALGRYAAQTNNIGAVFFHDCDFSRSDVSDPDNYYREVIHSITTGFDNVEFRNGVPMIPKTRSECWLLGYYQTTPYVNCARFENLRGSDKAAHPGKKLLADFLRCDETEIYRRVDRDIHNELIDWSRIDAPSFVFFKSRFQRTVQKLCHVAVTVPAVEIP